MKGPQHYIKHLKITLLVLLWYNSDVSFPIVGYRYFNRAKISWVIGGGRGPRGPPSKYAHEFRVRNIVTENFVDSLIRLVVSLLRLQLFGPVRFPAM